MTMNTFHFSTAPAVRPMPVDFGTFESGTNLSPDALMAYCQSRLDSIDGQVQSSFAQQN